MSFVPTPGTGVTGEDAQFPTTRTLNSGAGGTFSVLGFQNNDSADTDSGTRLYIVPVAGASVDSGVGGVLKIFADDYFADSTNYRDFGVYFDANQVTPSYSGGDTGTRGGGVFWFNSKVNGTFAGKEPDIGFGMQDGQYVAGRVALATVNGTTPNIQFVFGTAQPVVGTHVALVAEFQGDIGFHGDRAIRWTHADDATADNAISLIRTSGGGTVKFTMGSVQRMLLNGAGGLFLGNATGQQSTAAVDGFLNVWTMAGAPTGTPTLQTGSAPIVLDSTNKKLWAYLGGAWVGTPLS